jgi:gliding motility-associated-like protein
MPNAITPNGDGINDVLSLDSEGLTDFNVVILDAANTLVYSSTDPSFKWNGTLLNGDPAPAGTYQYYFTAKDENGTWCNQFSSLTILR